MREIVFLRNHSDKWKEFEQILDDASRADPDKLAELYISLTNDLAFAQSRYPGSKTTEYLNQLSLRVHDKLYKNRKEDSRRFITFWSKEIPLLFASKQKELLISFVVFSVAFVIGFFSASQDSNFVRLILGDAYVNMTIENIENDDPLAVYKKMKSMDMFLRITVNNIMVSFNAFVLGIFTVIGTGFVLLSNGIMLGSFLQFFQANDLLIESLLVVFIHGTLEISAIIIAGAAGIVLGNSFIFPGTLSRRRSFIKGAKEGIKMVTGLVPIFILAGFLESFVTRYTEMPIWLSLFIIVSSLGFILYYFIYLPQTLKSNRRYA
jgi:uncharacterized membrane protein SpoIIM required for sporulation